MNSHILELTLRLIVAATLGAIIGFEREFRAKEAGYRTHALVALGSALFMVVSQYGLNPNLPASANEHISWDASRIAASVVSGIGFIGAGTIMFQKHVVRGLTTAAGIWATGAIGLACGAGMYWISVIATALTLTTLELLSLLFKKYGLHSSIITFTTKDLNLNKEITEQLSKQKYMVVNYFMEHHKYENIEIYKITLTIKSRRIESDNSILQLLQSYPGITIESVEN